MPGCPAMIPLGSKASGPDHAAAGCDLDQGRAGAPVAAAAVLTVRIHTQLAQGGRAGHLAPGQLPDRSSLHLEERQELAVTLGQLQAGRA